MASFKTRSNGPSYLSYLESLGKNGILKRLHYKELSSRLVGLSFHGLGALSLTLLKTAGTTADKIINIHLSFPRLQTLRAEGCS